MQVGDFILTVVPKVRETPTGHVWMEHGTQYSVVMTNRSRYACDCEVSIDGVAIDVFRLTAHRSMQLECSPKDTGRFTFYKSGSEESKSAGEDGVAKSAKGLIVVRFVPEHPPVPLPQHVKQGYTGDGSEFFDYKYNPVRRRVVSRSSVGGACGQSVSSGVTGLSGSSNQGFATVGPINRDEDNAVTITLRLVAIDGNGARPLAERMKGNPVPEPVE